MNITGVAFSLTQQLLTISGGSPPLLLVITAIASFILGLPLPTVGVYIILATLAAPALVQAGIAPMQAHMFVLFNGILGMVTPPVALAAFAAATIAQSDQWQTGWTATRVGWCAYFLPFMFVYTPALIMNGSPLSIVVHLALALLGIFMGTRRGGRLLLRACAMALPHRLWRYRALLLLVQPRDVRWRELGHRRRALCLPSRATRAWKLWYAPLALKAAARRIGVRQPAPT